MMTEKELVEGIMKGSSAVFRQMFLQYYVIIFRFIDRFVHNHDSAKDIAQDIFMKVWVNRHRLNPEQSIKSYLYVLAKNAALNHIKHESHKSESWDVETLENVEDSRGADSALQFIELSDVVRQKIDSMPPQRQTVFRMSRYSQMSNKEIAETLGLSVRTVEKHLELAKKDMQTISMA